MTRDLSEFRYTLGRELAAARNRLSLSQADVAKRAGITQAAVSRLESGEINPQVTTLLNLVRALELDVKLIPRQMSPALDALLASQRAPGQDNRALYELEPNEDA